MHILQGLQEVGCGKFARTDGSIVTCTQFAASSSQPHCEFYICTSQHAWTLTVVLFCRMASHAAPPPLLLLHLLLQDGWLLDRGVVEKYLAAVESVYKANPYHNNTHAADVTQTAGVIMRALDQHLRTPPATAGNCSSSTRTCGCCFNCNSSSSASAAGASSSSTVGAAGSSPSSSVNNNSSSTGSSGGGLSKLERFAIIIASAVHDLGHPGVNNLFLVRLGGGGEVGGW